MTEIRPLIRSSDWGLWRGLASWQAETEETETYPGRPTPPQLDTHLLSAISSVSLERGDVLQHVACQCHSLSLFLPLYNPLPPHRWIGEILIVPCRHKHTHSMREHDEYSYRVLSTHEGGQREAERQIHSHAYTAYSAHTCSVMATCTHAESLGLVNGTCRV